MQNQLLNGTITAFDFINNKMMNFNLLLITKFILFNF
jgi:hypothetical protein